MFHLIVREEQRRLQAEKEQEENASLRAAQKQLTKEQKEAREKLMKQYGYVSEGEEEEEGEKKKKEELLQKDRRRGKTVPTSGKSPPFSLKYNCYANCQSIDPLLEANRNADIVKEKEQQRRDQMKHASEKEKERNRMLQQNVTTELFQAVQVSMCLTALKIHRDFRSQTSCAHLRCCEQWTVEGSGRQTK